MKRIRRIRRIRRVVLLVVLACALQGLPGCYGKFNVTGHIHSWNARVGGGWKSEGLFLICLPIYAFTMVSDAFVFNAFEFWTGINPIIPVPSEEPIVLSTPAGDRQFVLSVVAGTGATRWKLEALEDGRLVDECVIERRGELAYDLRSAAGQLLGSTRQLDDGSVTIVDALGTERGRLPGDDLAALVQRQCLLPR